MIEAVLGLVLWGLGYAIVFVLTFGTVRGKRWSEERSLQYTWYGLARDAQGQHVLSSRACAWMGGLTLLAAGIAYFVLKQ